MQRCIKFRVSLPGRGGELIKKFLAVGKDMGLNSARGRKGEEEGHLGGSEMYAREASR